MRKRIITIAIIALLVILMGMPIDGIFSSPSDVLTQTDNPSTPLRGFGIRLRPDLIEGTSPSTSPSGTGYNPSGEALSNAYVCSHYFSLLADELDRSETPFRVGKYESFRPGPSATLQRHFVSSGIYLPLEMETTSGVAVLYTIVAYWLTPEGELKEDLVALGVEFPDGGERFFLDDPAVGVLQAVRASMKPGVVFTATLTGLVNRHGPDWAGCPGSDFVDRFGKQACLVGAALAEGNPPDISSGFTGSFLFGWQLERTGEKIPFPICQYNEES